MFLACRSFVAATGVFFLVLNFLQVSYLAAGPLLFDNKTESKRSVAVVLGGGINGDGTPNEIPFGGRFGERSCTIRARRGRSFSVQG